MFLRARTEWRDALFYSPTVRRLGSFLYGLRARFSSGAAALALDCTAARLAVGQGQKARLEQRIRRRVASLGAVDWSQWVANWRTDRIEKAVILKPYLGPREKGVVFVAFEYQWVRLLSLPNLEEFAQRYTLVVAPSASPAYGLVQCIFPNRFPGGPVFSLLSNEIDRQSLQAQSGNIVIVPLYASSWVNPDRFYPDPAVERDIDILMVANFAPVKRHFALFRALREVPPHRRVVLVGQPDRGYTIEHVRRLAAAYGVAGRVEILDAVSHEEIAVLLRRSKTSILLSRREGASLIVPESLFSDTPMGILEDAVMGSRAFIQPQTGRFLKHANLGAQLEDFVRHAAQYRPRQWALDHGISCYRSTETLNRILKEHALASGQEWTVDLVPHAKQPDVMLIGSADWERLKPVYREFYHRYNLILGLRYTGD